MALIAEGGILEGDGGTGDSGEGGVGSGWEGSRGAAWVIVAYLCGGGEEGAAEHALDMHGHEL